MTMSERDIFIPLDEPATRPVAKLALTDYLCDRIEHPIPCVNVGFSPRQQTRRSMIDRLVSSIRASSPRRDRIW